MKVLVTGGAGFIGSQTVKLLLKSGFDVVVFDNFESGHRQALFPQARLFEGDIRKKADLEKCLTEHKVEACVHFAGYIVSPESVENPGKYFDNNVAGSFNLIEALIKHGIQKMVFSSSCSVYGTTERLPITETAPLHPESPYAESKYIVEKTLRWYAQAHNFASVALRYFNAAGADPDGQMGQDFSPPIHLIPRVIAAATGQAPEIKVFGTDLPTPDGTCIRDYIHVADLAMAHLKALEKLASGFTGAKAYNCGTGKGSSVKEIIEAVKRISGKDFKVTLAPRRAGDPVALYSDNTLIKRELGWAPQYGLDEIITHAWNWHLKHPQGY